METRGDEERISERTVITLEMPESAAKKLLELWERRDEGEDKLREYLGGLPLLDVRMATPSEETESGESQ